MPTIFFKKAYKKTRNALLHLPLFNADMRRIKTTEIDFSRLDLIERLDKDKLNNEAFLEKNLIPALGLNNEILEEFPESLYPYCGQGLYIWQYPNQFSKYLKLLSQYKVSSYLEIGIRHGGTFFLTQTYLRKFNKSVKAYGLDMVINPKLKKKFSGLEDITLIEAPSASPKFKKFVNSSFFDLAFIDGDHSYAGCLSDYLLLKDRSNILVFHDIKSSVCPGVIKVWESCKQDDPDNFHFYEFTEQYPEVVQRTGKNYLGIGVRVRKQFVS